MLANGMHMMSITCFYTLGRRCPNRYRWIANIPGTYWTSAATDVWIFHGFRTTEIWASRWKIKLDAEIAEIAPICSGSLQIKAQCQSLLTIGNISHYGIHFTLSQASLMSRWCFDISRNWNHAAVRAVVDRAEASWKRQNNNIKFFCEPTVIRVRHGR